MANTVISKTVFDMNETEVTVLRSSMATPDTWDVTAVVKSCSLELSRTERDRSVFGEEFKQTGVGKKSGTVNLEFFAGFGVGSLNAMFKDLFDDGEATIVFETSTNTYEVDVAVTQWIPFTGGEDEDNAPSVSFPVNALTVS